MKKLLIMGAIGLQLIILAGIFIQRQSIVWFGQEISIRPQVYDPRDELYGDYAQLRFAINTYELPANESAKSLTFSPDIPIYAVLGQDEDSWKVVSLEKKKPSRMPFLKATLEYAGERRVRLHYGFEKYFVEEGKGGELTDTIQNPVNDVFVVLAVSSDGDAVIKDLRISKNVRPEPTSTPFPTLTPSPTPLFITPIPVPSDTFPSLRPKINN